MAKKVIPSFFTAMIFDARETHSLNCRGWILELGEPTRIMGILNVTPDSFSDGGQYTDAERALDHALQMAADGAHIIDIGGESSRPTGPYGQGATPISVDEEIRRTVPLIKKIAPQLTVPISIDTTKTEVARRALDAGAHIVNDISAMRFDPKMAPLVAQTGAAVVLMHMQGTPRTMQKDPTYDDLIGDIHAFLSTQINTACEHGISREQIIIDTGLGFGKSRTHNLELLGRQSAFKDLACPILVGPSRKQFTAPDVTPAERLPGTMSALAFCVAAGAHIVRVHDVKEAVQAIHLADQLRSVLMPPKSP